MLWQTNAEAVLSAWFGNVLAIQRVGSKLPVMSLKPWVLTHAFLGFTKYTALGLWQYETPSLPGKLAFIKLLEQMASLLPFFFIMRHDGLLHL